MKCYKCNQELPDFEFHKSIRDNRQSKCKKCAKNYKTEYFQSLKENPRKRILHNMMKNSRERARLLGLDFNLTKSFLNANLGENCPVFNTPFYFECGEQGKEANPNTPSLDRIDNSKGYTTDNVKIISFKANRLKSNATLKELEQIVSYMKKPNGAQTENQTQT